MDWTSIALLNHEFVRKGQEERIAKPSGGVATFGKVTAGGIEPHNLLSRISLITTILDKTKDTEDNTSTGERTTVKLFLDVESNIISVTNNLKSSENFKAEEHEIDSCKTPIAIEPDLVGNS